MTQLEAYARIEAIEEFMDALVAGMETSDDWWGVAMAYKYQTIKKLEEGIDK
jgi:hypothetical protein